jgi:hypothetical protein
MQHIHAGVLLDCEHEALAMFHVDWRKAFDR